MTHLKTLAGLGLLLTLYANTQAQTANFGGWFATFQNYRIKNKFGAFFDGQIRSTAQVQQVNAILLRPGLTYSFNKNITATAGYAFVESRRRIGSVTGLAPEHRTWQQLIVRHKIATASVQHRFRQEQRFLSKAYLQNNEVKHRGHNYANRFRYFARAVVPLKNTRQFTKGAFTSLQNEVFLNVGNKKAVNGRFFDQNRLYGSVGYRFSPKFDAETGYMNQYMIQASGAVSNFHILQIATYVNL